MKVAGYHKVNKILMPYYQYPEVEENFTDEYGYFNKEMVKLIGWTGNMIISNKFLQGEKVKV